MEVTKGEAIDAYMHLDQIEGDYFSDKPKMELSKAGVNECINLLVSLKPVYEEYQELLKKHRKFFFKEFGIEESSMSQKTEEEQRSLSTKMTAYMAVDPTCKSEVQSFREQKASVKFTKLSSVVFEDTVIPHNARVALKKFKNG